MRRFFVPFVVMALGLLLGGAIAGWPSRVKSDVVIEGSPPPASTIVAEIPPVPTTLPSVDSTAVAEGPADATTLPSPESTAVADTSLPTDTTTPN